MCFAGNLCKTYADLMEDVTRIEDGRGVVYKRGGVYYARVRVGANKYVYRTLKTGKKAAQEKLKTVLRTGKELKSRVNEGH